MARHSAPPLALLLALALLTVASACPGRRICTFGHCQPFPDAKRGPFRRLTLRPPLASPPGPCICLKGFRDTMGFVRKTGEAIIEFNNGTEVPISKWRPEGLTKRFKKGFFRTIKKDVLKKSGIAKLKNQGNQWDFLENACVRLPILAYEKVNRRTGKVEGIVKGRKRSDCIAFGTRTVKLLVELNWAGKDDLDLKLIEPGGAEIDKFNPKSEFGGGFVGDRNAEKCISKNRAGKELVRYLSTKKQNFGKNVEEGEYRVEVVHFSNCGRGPTDWSVRVSVDGDLVWEKTGVTNRRLSEPVLNKTFTFRQ